MYTRTRQKGTKIAVPASGNGYHQTFAGVQSSFASGGFAPYSWKTADNDPFVVTKDVEILNFHMRRANGETFFNPFETTRESRIMRDQPCVARRAEGLFSGESTSNTCLRYRPDTLLTYGSAMWRVLPGLTYENAFGPDFAAISESRTANAALRDAAYNAALSDIAKTDALMLVSLAEFHQTVAMIGKYAFALNSRFAGLRDLAYNFWRNPKGMSREAGLGLATEYLTLRYGVMPLVYDIQGVVNALSAKQKPSRLTARGATGWNSSTIRNYSIAPATMYPGINLSSQTVVTGRFKAGFLYEPILDSLQTRLGLHPSVLPEVFFELTKLSFVADWFFDLSETIRALRADVHGNVIGGWVTEEVSSETIHSVSWGSPSQNTVNVGGVNKTTNWSYDSQPQSAVAYAFYTSKTRTPTGLPSVKTPTLRVQLNSLRVADAVALLASTLAGISAGYSRSIRL